MNQGMLFIGEAANIVETGIVVYFSPVLSLKRKVQAPECFLGNTVDPTVCAKPVKWIFCLQPLSGDPGGYRSGFCVYRDLYARDIHLKLLGCLFPF